MTRTLLLALLGLGTAFGARAFADPAPAVPPPAAPAAAPVPAPAAAPVEIVVQGGYHPDRVVVKEGEPVRLVFLRREYTGCTLEVVFPTLGVRRPLPPNEPVTIDLGTPAAGEIPFHCGMQMIHGVVVVEPKE